MRKRRWPSRTGSVLSLLVVTLSAGCAAPYLVRQVAGQVHLLARARPVAEIQDDASVDPDVRRGLAEVARVLEFARANGFSVGKAYQTFVDTGSEGPIWTVSASPPDRLEAYRWRFPFVGEVPYKGFFRRCEAEREAEHLRAEGYETIVEERSAYSTLGWFADPIFSTFLRGSAGWRAELCLHELTHRTLFLPGDIGFNESFASFVGKRGAERFLSQEYGPESEELTRYRQRDRDAERLSQLFREVKEELRVAFESPERERRLEARERIFADADRRLAEIPFESRAYRERLRIRWSIPLLLGQGLYRGDRELLAQVWDACDRDFATLFRVSRSLPGSGRPEDRLEHWLRQKRPPGAS